MTNKENYQFMKIKKVQNRDHQDINRNIDINFIDKQFNRIPKMLPITNIKIPYVFSKYGNLNNVNTTDDAIKNSNDNNSGRSKNVITLFI